MLLSNFHFFYHFKAKQNLDDADKKCKNSAFFQTNFQLNKRFLKKNRGVDELVVPVGGGASLRSAVP